MYSCLNVTDSTKSLSLIHHTWLYVYACLNATDSTKILSVILHTGRYMLIWTICFLLDCLDVDFKCIGKNGRMPASIVSITVRFFELTLVSIRPFSLKTMWTNSLSCKLPTEDVDYLPFCQKPKEAKKNWSTSLPAKVSFASSQHILNIYRKNGTDWTKNIFRHTLDILYVSLVDCLLLVFFSISRCIICY